MSKAVIYTRVSTKKQAKDDRFSLAVQKRLCEEYAKENKFEVIKIFKDAGKSATNMNRPALQDMLELIKEQQDIDVILVQDSDRFARNTENYLGMKAYLNKYNTKLISISQPFTDDMSPEGKMIDTIMASFNAFQSDLTGRKTKKGMEERARNGWLPREAPVGYINIKHKNDKKIIIPNPKTAPLIKKAFDLYITGNYGADTINEILYEKGLRGKRGGKLSLSKLYYLLNNPFYYGTFQWDKKLYKGKHAPLISKATHDLAKKIKSSRAIRRSYERKHSFLLSGFAFCKCGRRLTAEYHIKPSQKTYCYYHCTRGKKCHDSRNIQLLDLEVQVEEEFKEVNFSDKFFDKLIKKLKQYYNNYDQENKTQISKIDKRKSELLQKKGRVENLLIDNVITKEVYTRKVAEIDNDLESFKNRKTILSKEESLNIGKFEELVEFSRNIYKSYKGSDYEAKRNYLGFFWEKFIVEDKKIIEAIPTEPYKLLQKIQKPLLKGEFIDLSRVIKT